MLPAERKHEITSEIQLTHYSTFREAFKNRVMRAVGAVCFLRLRAIALARAYSPPCITARRGVTHQRHSFTSSWTAPQRSKACMSGDSEFQQPGQVSAQDHLFLIVRNLCGQNVVHRVRPGENRNVGAINDLGRTDFLDKMPYALG